MSMLKEERLDYILKKLQTDHKVLQAELSSDLQVSEDTVRRDLESLAQNGQLIKVRGGAIPHSPNPYSFKERIQYHENDKKHIARKALPYLHNGQTIILDGGTSTLTLAKLFPANLHITVITNSVPIVAQLIEHPGQQRVMTRVVHDEAAVDAVIATVLHHVMCMRVAAKIAVGLEQRHIVPARQQPCRCESCDT